MKCYFYGALCTAIALHGSYLTPEQKVTGVAFWPVTIAAAVFAQANDLPLAPD